MVDFIEAIKRPFTDLKALIIGVLLTIVAPFTLGILMLPVMGYGLRTAKNTLNNNPALPKWDNWGDLFVKGLVALIVSVIYLIPAIIVIVLGVANIIASIPAISLTGAATPEAMQAAIMQAIMPALAANALLFLVGLILALVAFLLLPMALMRYVKEERFGAAFGFGEILGKVFTGKYIVAWVVVVVYSTIVSAILGFVPVLGSVVAMFLVMVTEYTVFAQAYNELSGAAPASQTAAPMA